jgi:uncharacterized membrane protein YdjX (TVP38/TMEM64 family)
VTRGRVRAVLVAVALIGGVVAIGWLAGHYVQRFAGWVDGLGVWGPVVFVLGYAVSVVAFVPASVLTLAAGAIFGVAWGTVYVLVAATAGATVAFLIARHLAREAVERWLAGNARFASLDRAVGAEGRKIVFLLRLSPVFPFTALNYALGLTNVRFADYLIACVGMIPGTLLYVYSGKLAGDVAVLASGAPVDKGPGYYALLTVGLVATVVVTTVVTRLARRALDDATAAGPVSASSGARSRTASSRTG